MTIGELQQLAVTTAIREGLDPALVCAICEHESNWNPWAVRYEPAFYSRYIESLTLSPTEKSSRAFSYGLCQVMGQVAREQGFKGKYLSELCDPNLNLAHGCKKLANCLRRMKQDVTLALLRYNGGANLEYPGMVINLMPKYQARKT